MKKDISSLLFIFLLLCISTSAFEPNEGCLVSERIVENEVLFGTLEFLALIPESGNIKARISCQDRTERYVEWNLTKVSTPNDTGGWMQFVLRFVGSISLFDARNQTRLSNDLPLNACVVSGIELTGSKFTRKCSSESLVWKVSAEPVDIPLKVGGSKSETISLFSLTDFSPVFSFGGAEVHLRMKGDEMVANGDDYDPLSAVRDYRFQFQASEGRGGTVFQVFSLDEFKSSIYTLNLPEVPKEMHVRSNDKAMFALIQFLNPEVHDTTGSTCPKFGDNKDLTLALLAILGCMTLFFGILLVQYVRLIRSQKTTERPKPHSLNRNSSPEDAQYLEPTPIQLPQAQPLGAALPSPTARIISTLSEHMYEEMDDIIPHHYENSSESFTSNDLSIPSEM